MLNRIWFRKVGFLISGLGILVIPEYKDYQHDVRTSYRSLVILTVRVYEFIKVVILDQWPC